MYKITDELDAAGFSINTIEALVKRNNNKFSFSTLEYFVIYVAYTDATLTVDGCKFRVPSNHLAYKHRLKTSPMILNHYTIQ